MLVFFLGFPLASAHPFLLDSEPGQGQNAPAGTTQIITNYSEAVEIGFSELRVYDACLLYTSPSPRDGLLSRMPSSA